MQGKDGRVETREGAEGVNIQGREGRVVAQEGFYGWKEMGGEESQVLGKREMDV